MNAQKPNQPEALHDHPDPVASPSSTAPFYATSAPAPVRCQFFQCPSCVEGVCVSPSVLCIDPNGHCVRALTERKRARRRWATCRACGLKIVKVPGAPWQHWGIDLLHPAKPDWGTGR